MIPIIEPLSSDDRALFQEAWDTARSLHGTDITFYLPGMIRYGRDRGKYPAVSITADRCDLQCDHCRGRLLQSMIPADSPSELVQKTRLLKQRGAHGILLSGGSDREGRLPWKRFAPAIRRISEETGLMLTAHAGFPDTEDSELLFRAGIRQALIDVMGDDETASRVYHLPGLNTVTRSLSALADSGLPLAPHIVAGLDHGRIRAEFKALEIIRSYDPAVVVIVVLTALPGTPMASVTPPRPIEIARLIARARLLMPGVPLCLGCERPRNRDGALLEILALNAGITGMAVWSEEAVKTARDLGLIPRFQTTCCSIPFHPSFSSTGPR